MYPKSSARRDGLLMIKLACLTCKELFKTQNSKNFFSRLVNQQVHRLSANRHIGTGAEGDEQIHLCSKIHVAARFGAHRRMIHAAGHTVDFHVLIEVEWIGYIFGSDAVRRQSPRKIFV